MPEYDSGFRDYIPQAAVVIVDRWLKDHPAEIRVARSRVTKTGDFRPSLNKYVDHRISVNYDLDPYAFLLTLTHEIAHLLNWKVNRRRVSPHGAEWQVYYKKLVSELLNAGVFPEQIASELRNSLSGKIPACSSSHQGLHDLLHKPHINKAGKVCVKDLPEGSLFKVYNNKVFRKGPLLRKRFKCQCVNNKKWYLVGPLTEAVPVSFAMDLD